MKCAEKKRTITVWGDLSAPAMELREELKKHNFNLHFIFSGSPEPTIEYHGAYISGYGNIRCEFLYMAKTCK